VLVLVAFVLIAGVGLLTHTLATFLSRRPLTFDFTVRHADAPRGQPPRFLGEYTQGPPASRFVYVNSGTAAGQADTFGAWFMPYHSDARAEQIVPAVHA